MDLVDWPLLDPVGVTDSQHGGLSIAAACTSIGREVDFWFEEDKLAKGVMLLHTSNLETPDPYGGYPIRSVPEVVCTHMDLALLRLSTPHRNFPTDYFVYRYDTGGQGGDPWVVALPEIEPVRLYSDRSVGLLRASDGGCFVVANLRQELSDESGELEAILDLYSSWNKKWSQGKVTLPFSFSKEDMCEWQTDMVIPFEESLVWVDLSRGILRCSNFLPMGGDGDSANFKFNDDGYILLPAELVLRERPADGSDAHWEWPEAFRSVACCDGKLKLVNICCPDHDTQVVVEIWTLDGRSWNKEQSLQYSDIWATMEHQFGSPDSVLPWKEKPPRFPLLRTDNSDILHLTLAGRNKAFLLQIDMTDWTRNRVTEYSRLCQHRKPLQPQQVCAEGMGWFKDAMQKLRNVLVHLSAVEVPDHQAKCWRAEVRELCYDLEDAIDKSSSTDDQLMPLGLAQRAKAVLQRVKKLSVKESNVIVDPREDQTDLSYPVGVDDQKKKIIELLGAHRVVSIVGLGGSGKTTLAHQVCNEIAITFQYQARVSVGPNTKGILPDMKMKGVLISLLRQFGENSDQLEHLEEIHLVNLIQKRVQDKGFFVVADDIWNEKEWMVIRHALLQNNSAGRVIMTTTINDIASLGDYVYHIRPLSEVYSKLLLHERVFGSDKCTLELEDLRDSILEKCGGLPLAIIAVSDVLKKEKSITHWKNSYNSLNRADAEDPIKKMRRTLSLAYNELPYHIRMCLLYLSIFPARQKIKRKRLVHRWISQGLVQAQNGENVADLGDNYFNELINRNLIEPDDIKYDDQARACRVHNAVLDFIVYKSAEENFVTLVGYPENKERKKIRNLSIQNMQDVTQLGEVSHVRSLTIFGPIEQLPSPLKSCALRVLDLEDCKPLADGSVDRNKTIVDARSTVHLRYLSLRAAGMNGPQEAEIGKIRHLETLDLRERLVGKGQKLDITGLTQVVRLFVDSKTTLKADIGKMNALEEVKYISVSKHSVEFLMELGQLSKLRVLGIHLDAQESSDEQMKALVSSVIELGNCKLRSLYIDGTWEIYLNLVSNGDSGQPTVPSLRKLKLRKWCYFNEVPTWMGSLKNLEKLRLGVSQMKQDQLAILGVLPCLLDLFVDILEVKGEEIIFERLTGFRCLKCLGISCRTKMKVIFEFESVPCLKHLKLHLDVRDGVIPEGGNIVLGIKHLSSLTRFEALLYCIRKTDAVVKDVKDAMQKEAGDYVTIEFMEKQETETDDGALMSTVCEKVGDLKKDEYQVRELTKAGIDINKLQDLLQHARIFLRMLSDDENPNQQVKEWRNTVREFCYDMEDAIHSLSVLLPDWSSPTADSILQELKTSFHKTKQQLPKRTNENLQWYGQTIANYMPGTSGSWSSNKATDRSEDHEAKVSGGFHSSSIDLHREASNLVGTDANRNTIIRWLTGDGDRSSSSALAQGHKVVSIVGFGGVGKTALAKQVYHSIKGQFDCAAIVQVSRKLSIHKLIKDILSQFMGTDVTPKALKRLAPDEYVHVLQNYIQDKRYFVVLDDIWKEDDWVKIEGVFSANNPGSIITTTRIRSVAKKCSFPDDPLELEPLNTANSKTLLLQRVFGSAEGPNYPEQTCKEIVKKCGGSPLAILTISSLLANNTSPSGWVEVLKSMGPGISKEPSAEDMRRALSPSYYDLRYPIRMCLLYLSIFPEDYVINRKRLINRWIAEGLIDAPPEKTQSEVGENYFNELINRSLIQPVKTRYDGKVKTCRVHDTILDFIVSMSIEENFVTLLGAQEKMSDNKIHRLSLQNIDEADANNLVQRDLSHIRSLTIFGPVDNIPIGLKFPILRVLDLEDCYEPYPRNCSSEGYSIGNVRGLSHLQYLNLRPVGTTRLPEQIGDLLRLQTLDLREVDVEELPVSITRLRHLVRLLVSSVTKLPDGIREMKALEELKDIDVGEYSEDFLEDLGQLSNLRSLGMVFNPSTVKKGKERALLSSLSTLGGSCKLYSLSMEVVDPDKEPFGAKLRHFESRWEQAVLCLHKLRMKWGYVLNVPTWMEKLDKLEKLRLGIRGMNKEDLDILGRLQGLLDLFLDLTKFPQEKLVLSSSNGFQTLVYFGIKNSIKGMTKLTFKDGFMSSVKYFRLQLDAKDRAIPQSGELDFGIQHLRSLKVVDVTIWCHRRTDEVVEATMAAIQNAARSHCNLLTLKFEIYSWDKEEDEDDSQEEEVDEDEVQDSQDDNNDDGNSYDDDEEEDSQEEDEDSQEEDRAPKRRRT